MPDFLLKTLGHALGAKLHISLISLVFLQACSQKSDLSRVCKQPKSFVQIPDGTLTQNGRDVLIKAFKIHPTEVTNAEFSEFITSTNYVTTAERIDPATGEKWGSAVFIQPVNGATYWWRLERNASWRCPTGGDCNMALDPNMPVVHISYEDAVAFANWVGGRLPTEAEWEYVARAGHLENSKPAPDTVNTWQGVFPVVNEGSDGYLGIAPAGCFRPNDWGLYDMIGNAWEWTALPTEQSATQTGVLAGGSFLCSDNFCSNYTPSGRQVQELNFSASHIGFRVAYD